MTTARALLLVVAWIAWVAPFFLSRRNAAPRLADTIDRRARWGIVLQGMAYALVLQAPFWRRSVSGWQVAASLTLFGLAISLSWTGVRALGRQWRVDAGLNRDHALVRSGPYRLVRHPIYASMLCLLLGTVTLVATVPLGVVAVAIFIAGIEIRVRIEDALLAARFGSAFTAFRQATPAYIPLIR